MKTISKNCDGSSNHRSLLTLLALVVGGTILRLWNLAQKPLWVDEVITSIFSLGQSFDDMPVNQVLALRDVPALFTLNPGTSCSAIAAHLATQSTHPPLFFCLLHSWLVAIAPWTENLAWQLRSFSVLWGVVAIAAVYLLNRVAFSPKAGLWGAVVMALSPFAVYLSQETRHYTLPIVLITLMLTCQVKLHQQLVKGRSRLWLWVVWGLCSCVALYTHYFCLLAIAAQLGTFFLFWWRSRFRLPGLGLTLYALPFLGFLPWSLTFLAHFNSPKTGWLSAPDGINPLLQTVAGWIVMFITSPVERQPVVMQVGSGLITLVGLGFLVQWAIVGLKKLPTSSGKFTLLVFLGLTVLEFFTVIYGLQKDISIAPRYHFVYFPAICALWGATLSMKGRETQLLHHEHPHRDRNWLSLLLMFHKYFHSAQLWTVIIMGISSLCVVYNLAFQKPYAPQIVAEQFNQTPEPVAVMMAYHNTLEMAVGLSYGLAWSRIRDEAAEFTLVEFTDTFEGIWNTLQSLPIAPQYLWAIAPGYHDDTFPATVTLTDQQICYLEPEQIYRIGFPYQRYRCE